MADTYDSLSGWDDDFDSSASQGPSTSTKSGKSTRKESGAVKNKSKFNKAWKKQYPFIN